MARQPISKRLRFEVFKRDGFTCQYCGRTPPAVLLEADHVHPLTAGGATDADNLVTSCQDCNRGKGAVPLDAVPQSLAERAAEVAEREAQIAAYAEVMDAARQRLEDDAWRIVNALEPGVERFPIAHLTSIKRFVRDLGVHAVIEAAELAHCRKEGYREDIVWKYFCGICWNKIRELQRDG
jgi:hypothetical protein